jgi:hypothetical protein
VTPWDDSSRSLAPGVGTGVAIAAEETAALGVEGGAGATEGVLGAVSETEPAVEVTGVTAVSADVGVGLATTGLGVGVEVISGVGELAAWLLTGVLLAWGETTGVATLGVKGALGVETTVGAGAVEKGLEKSGVKNLMSRAKTTIPNKNRPTL